MNRRKYNKGKCKFGQGCHYDHRCSYCHKFTHTVLTCRKLIADRECAASSSGKKDQTKAMD